MEHGGDIKVTYTHTQYSTNAPCIRFIIGLELNIYLMRMFLVDNNATRAQHNSIVTISMFTIRLNCFRDIFILVFLLINFLILSIYFWFDFFLHKFILITFFVFICNAYILHSHPHTLTSTSQREGHNSEGTSKRVSFLRSHQSKTNNCQKETIFFFLNYYIQSQIILFFLVFPLFLGVHCSVNAITVNRRQRWKTVANTVFDHIRKTIFVYFRL